MKIRPTLLAVFGGSLILAAVSGCASPDVANNKKNQDNLAVRKEEARGYERKDGSLGADYLVDLALNGGKKTNKPAFDQPRGNDAPTR